MHTRSRRVEIPNGRSLPLALGMNTRPMASGRYFSSLSASASSPSHRSAPYVSISAKSFPSTPGAPLFERHWAQAWAEDIVTADLVVQGVETKARLAFAFACNAICSFWTLPGVARLPNPRSLATCCVRPVQGPFPPPALPGFPGTTGLSATSLRPDHPSPESGWPSPATPRGFPCCARFPCVHAAATTPAQPLAVPPCSSVQRYQPSPKG